MRIDYYQRPNNRNLSLARGDCAVLADVLAKLEVQEPLTSAEREFLAELVRLASVTAFDFSDDCEETPR